MILILLMVVLINVNIKVDNSIIVEIFEMSFFDNFFLSLVGCSEYDVCKWFLFLIVVKLMLFFFDLEMIVLMFIKFFVFVFVVFFSKDLGVLIIFCCLMLV